MNAQSLHILVVDDDDVDREKMRRLLRKTSMNIKVTEACSRNEALQKLQSNIFDCVIIDYRLGDAEGISLINPIRTHKPTQTPIIMVSGLGDERLAANAIKDGVFEYLPKNNLESKHIHSAISAGIEWAKIENVLFEEHRRFSELADGLPQLVWTCTPDGKCDFLNKRWAEFTGIAAEEQLGYKWLEQIHPDDKDNIFTAWTESLAQQTPLSTQYRIRRYDNIYRLFDARALPHKDAEGNITRWLGSSTDITEAEHAHLVQANLAAIVESSIDAILSKNVDGIITSWNIAAEELFGYTQEEAIGKNITELIIPREYLQEEIELTRRLKAGEKIKAFDTLRRTKDGRLVPVTLTFSAIKDKDGILLGFAKIVRNISEKLAAESALLRSEQRFRATFDSAPVGMATVSLDGYFIEVNHAFLNLLECDFNQLSAYKQIDITAPKDQLSEADTLSILHIQHKNSIEFEKTIYTFSGKEICVLTSVALLSKDGEPEAYLYQYIDLSERKQYESRLLQLAHYDPLTGLANRTKFNIEIENLLYQAKRNSVPFGVLFGDLDHFKHINDSLGHEVGDKLLKTVALRLKSVLRQGDTVARLGGDEFVILLSSTFNFEQVASVAQKIMKLISEPMTINDQNLHIGMSFGIAIYPFDGSDAGTLLRNADSALYDAKSKGRRCYSLYRKELTDLVDNRLKLDADLRKAIEEKQFELYYQPVVSLASESIISAEALIRWNHPTKGIISPDNFIPYAQECGLILELGSWILHEACQAAKKWQSAKQTIPIAVNISARQFQDGNLMSHINSALEKSKLDRNLLHLEITEQLFLENTEKNLMQIEAIKESGVKISLDDFGIGYSSLSYIIRFSPHFLKIDKSFISKIGAASHYDGLVEAIINLQKILPMNIIAEGVETYAQRDFLQKYGCDLAQGYLFSKPISEKEFIIYVKNYKF